MNAPPMILCWREGNSVTEGTPYNPPERGIECWMEVICRPLGGDRMLDRSNLQTSGRGIECWIEVIRKPLGGG